MEMIENTKGEMARWPTRARCLGLFLILNVLSFISTQAQTLDYRATLEVGSYVQSYSLSPSGRLWMATRLGEVFYVDSIGGLWHEVKLPRSSQRKEDYTIDHVFTPDGKTIVLAGYIRAPQNKDCTGNYIISTDGGRTWEFRELDRCYDWIDESWCSPDNRIWMGGLSGRLLYSDDNGQTFRTIHTTDTTGDRIGAICMDGEGRRGVLAVFGNKLYLTDDGFQSVRRIETPKVQGALVLDRDGWYGRIHAAYQWRQWIVLNQEGRWFYSDRDSLLWHSLPGNIQPAYLTPDATHMIARMGDSVMLMSTPTDGQLLGMCQGRVVWSDGHDVIATTLEALEVLRDGVATHYPFYTTDYPIKEPYYKVRYNGRLWGYNGRDIYLKKGRRWGRVVHTDFNINGLLPADTCLLVESDREVYSITRQRTQPTVMHYDHPLGDFLNSKVNEIVIACGSRGCFHYHKDTIRYRREASPTHPMYSGNGDQFRLTYMSLHDTVMPLPLRTFAATDLEDLLLDFDRAPNPPIRRSELGVTTEDRAALLADTAEFNEFVGTTPRVLRQVAENFDSIPDSLLAAAMVADEGIWSTTSNVVRILLVNATGDTLMLERVFFENAPYLLPYRVQLQHRILYAAHLPLMRFLGQQMPEGMMFRRQFTPLTALRRLADRLDTNR